jgi:ZIP family zinc transporter
MTRFRSFWYGQLSGIVEPVAGVFGVITVVMSRAILPYALAFAAGAMIFVVIEDIVPESQCEGHTDIATMGTMVGFAVMMAMDVAFG